MKFENTLIKAKLIKRYKRFLVDAKLKNSEVVTAHCANTGSMKGLVDEGNTIYLSPSTNPKRKLKYSLEIIDVGSSLVGVNTSLPNKLAESHILAGDIPSLSGYSSLRREVKYGKNSRIDILLEGNNKPPCYVEVKNITLREGSLAKFPDAVTTRGTKHLNELMDMVKEGKRAVMLYIIQREDCKKFAVAADIDPIYAKTLQKAVNSGVEVLAYSCNISVDEISINKQLEVQL